MADATSNDSTSYGGLGYAYDKVVFKAGKPILDSELNLSQELQEILSQKSTGHLCSGWMSYRPYYTSKTLSSAFYTQDPEGAKPEVALVNGWSVYVTNTATSLRHVNKIDLSGNELRSGSRVDGVFLEVWRSLITPTDANNPESQEGVAKPQPLTKVADLRGVYMYNELVGWIVGDSGVILKTVDGGVKWTSVATPVNIGFRKVKFLDSSIGYAVGDHGTVIKTIDGGDSWYVLEVPVTDDLLDLDILDEQHVCIVGKAGVVLLSHDGTTFTLITEVSENTNDLNSVYFFDSAVGWAVGNNGALLLTKDGGNIWERYTVIDNHTQEVITTNITSVAFYNLNDGIIVGEDGLIMRSTDSGFSWSDVSDRIWDSGAYTTLSALYPNASGNLRQVFIKEDYPIKFTIAVYPDSKNLFKNITYKISPVDYPNSMVFEYTGVQDNINYITVLDLESYPTAESLRDAINAIMSPYKLSDASLPDNQRTKVRVFEAAIEYEGFGKPSDYRPTYGAISSLRPAEISFSVEDKAWIVGEDGVVLTTANSGAKWEKMGITLEEDFNSIYMLTNTLGYLVGGNGTIVIYDPATYTGGYEIQDSDLNAKAIGRIFPEGNILSGAADYLIDDIIDPQVNVETTKRVQIQYRIRVVDGIDPFSYPEAGLGMQFVYSLGPNDNSTVAGSYTFENMGTENGDYGLWRSHCRNTYDGYSWAIPMFFVTRRNSSAFNIDTNINGSTYYDVGAVRPDGLLYENIMEDDIVDIRRSVVVNSYSYHLQKNFDKLMSNQLRMNISNKDQHGFQYGATIMAADSYVGDTAITSLVQRGVSSTAIIQELVKTLDPNITITEAELTFGPLSNGLFHNEKAYYSAYVERNGTLTSERVDGNFEGLGTATVKFNLSTNFAPQGGTLTGIKYVVTAHYMDYSTVGLSKVPQSPICVKYQSNPALPDTSLYYNGIDSKLDTRVYEYLTENTPGYVDYTVLYAAKYIQDTKDDRDLYEIVGHMDWNDTDFRKGLRKFEGQQLKGSLMEYHYFFKTTTSTTTVRVPKNLNGYAIFGVKKVQNVNGSVYKISSDFAADMSIRDREDTPDGIVTSNVVVYLDEAFVIPANAVVEVTCEAVITADVYGGTNPNIGITVRSSGENSDALRTSLTSNFDVASRGIGGMYTGILYPYNNPSQTDQLDINLGTSSIPAMVNATALGLASYETKFTTNQMYIWYKSNDPEKDYYTTVPVTSVEAVPTVTTSGLGTSRFLIKIDINRKIDAGSVLIPLLVQQNTMPGLTSSSAAYVFYKYVPYQCLGNLPSEMILEIVNVSDFVYISNLGTGASNTVFGEPYEIPLEHIAVNNDTVSSDNFFSNVDDLNFANFSIDTGFIKLPAIMSSGAGNDITLSSPNNVGDRLGRPYYTVCSSDLIYQAEHCTIATPRKVFVPVLARVRSDILAPVARGELVLLIFSKVYEARLENKTGYYEDADEEYLPGYYESVNTAISVYRLVNKPIVRK